MSKIGLSERRFTTISGVEVEPFYDAPPPGDVPAPGEFPYTRGIHRDMYRGKLWTMRQFSGFGTPEETNRRYHYLLEQGQTGLSVAFDLPRPSMRLVTDTIEFGARHTPRFNPISISGYHIREAGSTAVQELAFTLRDGVEYVEWALERGLDVDEFAPRLSFFFNAHNDFFEEIAKFRAARKIWAEVMRDRFGAQDERSFKLRFHAQTAGCSLTWQQPYNNIVLTTIQALAAVMGDCQSLHTNSLDEAYALPSEHAVTIALRTQQVIAHESGVPAVVDPLGGSYFVERLTLEMEERARDYIRRIDE